MELPEGAPGKISALILSSLFLVFLSVLYQPATAAVTKSTAWQNGKFNINTASVVAQSNIILGTANVQPTQSMPLGNGTLGAAVWAASGFTAQLNRGDTFPDRKSLGQVVIPGLSKITTSSNYSGQLDLYNGVFKESGGGMTATAYVLQNKDELVIDVTGADPNTVQTAQIQLWTGRAPTASASGSFATLAETFADNTQGGSSGQTFGTLAGITAGGRNITTSVVDPTTLQIHVTPNADGTFRIIVAGPAWKGGDALQTVQTLIGSDATLSTAALQSTHLTWWHNFWSKTGLIKITNTSGPYVENLRDIGLYAMAISSNGQYPGNHAGVLDLVSSNKDAVTWFPSGFWEWNLRMDVGTNMAAGHPELNAPYFNLYQSNLANIQAWTKQYMGGDGVGICVPETMRFNGNGYYNGGLGGGSCISQSNPNYNALTLTSGAEVGLWVWQQYLYTGDLAFLQKNYPLMADSARFLLSYAKVGSDGKLHTSPSNAHETQWGVSDPNTDIAAMKALFPATVAAAQKLGTDAALVTQLQTAIPKILDYQRTDIATKSQALASTSDAAGKDMLGLSANPTATMHNSENVGLEIVYPYGLIGNNNGTETQLALRTFTNRTYVNANNWAFDATQAARLGDSANFLKSLTDQIQKYQKFISGFGQPFSTDPSYYVETTADVANAVQEALVEDYDDTLRIAPAWPLSTWDVAGTVYIHGNSKVDVQIENGTLAVAIVEAGTTGNIAALNPWGTQKMRVIDLGTKAVVVAATTANKFTIPAVAGHAYSIELTSAPISSLPYTAISATAATSYKTFGPVSIGLAVGPPPPPPPPPPSEAPYKGTAWPMPGIVQGEDFDTGGQGVAYSKASAGTSGVNPPYRSDEANNIDTTSDTGGGYEIGWTNTGDWYKYTVNVTATGSYALNIRVASPNTGSKYHVEIDGVNVTGSMTVPNTGNWQAYVTQSTSTALTAGKHILRYVVDNGGMNFNWMSITAAAPPPPPSEAPYKGTAWPMPGTVQAEDYDAGGQSVAYFKSSPGTSGVNPPYRADEANNIDTTNDGGKGYEIGWTNTGDWYKYTVNVTQSSTSTYTLSIRVASPNTGSKYHVEIDGTNVTGTMTVPNTGDWQTYVTQTSSNIPLAAGTHTLRYVIEAGGMNFNWMSISI